MIPVTKPYLPSRKKLDEYIDGIYERYWLTNDGPLVQELTARLEKYLGVENLLLVSNGTLALQIAYRALGVSGGSLDQKLEAITTPFTFIATASSMAWDGLKPVFADIDPKTWCLDPHNIESLITPQTRMIVPVHVFGNSCDVQTIETVARKHNLKVIYDACHAFGVKINGRSLLSYGDAATLSFHATKLFHTGEGGAIVFRAKRDLERAKRIINFGIIEPGRIGELGINAKMSELSAAMGLCVLDEIEEIMTARAAIWSFYEKALDPSLHLLTIPKGMDYNYSYFPVVFQSEEQAVQVLSALAENGIFARRYFYPSLESIQCLEAEANVPISKDIASRILCLPLYPSLKKIDQLNIIKIIEKKMVISKG